MFITLISAVPVKKFLILFNSPSRWLSSPTGLLSKYLNGNESNRSITELPSVKSILSVVSTNMNCLNAVNIPENSASNIIVPPNTFNVLVFPWVKTLSIICCRSNGMARFINCESIVAANTRTSAHLYLLTSGMNHFHPNVFVAADGDFLRSKVVRFCLFLSLLFFL